ncbi:Uncharacterized protein TCM_031328 isoform 1 [Theobroma cacao]|uniref:Uncharacterized protein isoform 1 n=1 Tax=Theobroma cacao TaxID=3641 RepID=A0A061F7Y5_THECC|nr:Uncharacterized protein TCM_031328 isoform 1 [Theobroma cacao]
MSIIECLLELSSSTSSYSPFQKLEKLELVSLYNLHVHVKIKRAAAVPASRTPAAAVMIFCLKIFTLIHSTSINKLLPSGFLKDLQHLEEILVSSCKEMQEIIASEEEEENHKGEGTNATITMALPNPRQLPFFDSPKLERIWCKKGVMKVSTMADTIRTDVVDNVLNAKRRDTIGRFLTNLGKFAVDSAASVSLKGFTGGKKLYEILQERFKAQPTPPLLNCKRKSEDDKLMEKMQLAKMEDMNEVKQESKTAGKPVAGSEPMKKKKIPHDMKDLGLQNPDRKRIFIRSRL